MMNRAAEGLDLEWLALIIEAKEIGISKEAVRNFLKQPEGKELVADNN